MSSLYSDSRNQSATYRESNSQTLLGSGWRPLYRELDLPYLWQLISRDPWELTQQLLDVCSDVADALGRKEYTWWANLLHVFSENSRYEMSEFWDFITPPPAGPDYHYHQVLSSESPVIQDIGRDQIPIHYVLSRLQEVTVLKVLAALGPPDRILQTFFDRHFYYPIERFAGWEQLESLGLVSAYWQTQDIWLQIRRMKASQKQLTLIGKDLRPWVKQATKNLAVMLSGYQSQVGQVQSAFPLSSFPEDIQAFTDMVQRRVLTDQRLAVLVHGEPGTGKTAWTQALAHEVLTPRGFVVFILDHDAVEHFVPPGYLEHICLIINETDNLAQDRASQAGRLGNKTEHILSLLDGTLYQSVRDMSETVLQPQVVVLLTCNTTERLDPAMLRRGRVDLTFEFRHRFV